MQPSTSPSLSRSLLAFLSSSHLVVSSLFTNDDIVSSTKYAVGNHCRADLKQNLHVARNVYGGNEELTEHSSDGNNNAPAAATAVLALAPPAETRRFWHGHRFLNFLLACMVFAFVISWLFHFNVPSS